MTAPTPTLSERDARLLTEKVVTELHKMGARVREFGVYLQHEGFSFAADINGKRVWVQTGQGNFTYRQVAADLLGQTISATPLLVAGAGATR
jgi:hypothetical protein